MSDDPIASRSQGRVPVVGAGAIGAYFGDVLASGGHPVEMLARG